MQRADREITDRAQMESILAGCEVLRLGLTDGTRAYIVPLHYAHEWVDGALTLYMHGALQGRKMDMLRENPLVCFEMDRGVETITASAPCGYSATFESIVGEGEVRLLAGLSERVHGLDLLMAKHGFQGKPQYHSATLQRTAVLAIQVTQLAGKERPKPTAPPM